MALSPPACLKGACREKGRQASTPARPTDKAFSTYARTAEPPMVGYFGCCTSIGCFKRLPALTLMKRERYKSECSSTAYSRERGYCFLSTPWPATSTYSAAVAVAFNAFRRSHHPIEAVHRGFLAFAMKSGHRLLSFSHFRPHVNSALFSFMAPSYSAWRLI